MRGHDDLLTPLKGRCRLAMHRYPKRRVQTNNDAAISVPLQIQRYLIITEIAKMTLAIRVWRATRIASGIGWPLRTVAMVTAAATVLTACSCNDDNLTPPQSNVLPGFIKGTVTTRSY